MPGRVRSMVLGPAVTLEARRAARSEPGTPSARVVTLKMAGASRPSRLSRVSRHRAGALRIVREANRLPSQEWMVMECLLPEKAGPRRKKGTAPGAHGEPGRKGVDRRYLSAAVVVVINAKSGGQLRQ